MDKSCLDCQKAYKISNDDQAFYSKINVPPPKSCRHCRLIRRLMERNPRRLYRRKCDFSGKEILSMYHKDQLFPVYDVEYWWGDEWDAMDFGQDIDFTRSFFDQFLEIRNQVPHTSRYVIQGTIENCDFTNCIGYAKNCYLVGECDYLEDCYYGNRLYTGKNLVDCSNCYGCELSFEIVDCRDCQRLQYSQDCQNCHDSLFLKFCIGCTDCIGCMNQRQKNFMIFNEQLTNEEYKKKKEELRLNIQSGIDVFKIKCEDFFLTQPHKYVQAEQNENCTGDHLYNSKNSFECMDCKDLEDCKYCAKIAGGVKDSMDYNSWGFGAERIYMSSACGDNILNLKFCTTCTSNLSDCEYCDQCTSSSDLFGCVGLKRKKFCIFNKQYSENKYRELRKKLIEHMRQTGEYGEYFPKDMCPFTYNETLAMEDFPLSKDKAISLGYKWRDEVDDVPDVKKIIPAYKLPETIGEVPDDVLSWAIKCEETDRLFIITKQELGFYRQFDIPIPRLHPNERHMRRLRRRPPRQLWMRTCDACGKEIRSTYQQNCSKIVYCTECYRKEVY